MADDKKKPPAGGKPTTGDSGLFHKDHHKEVFYLLAALIILGAIVTQLTLYFQSFQLYDTSGFWGSIVLWFLSIWPTWQVVALIITAVCLVWSAFSILKREEVKTEEEKIYGPIKDEAFSEEDKPAEPENELWMRVVELSNSNNSSDWRLAIIEADVMLEDLLREAGYLGDGVGEMLKSVDPTDMLTLNAAWDAHKVRNRIAHGGGDLNLDERETRRVIALFESVFREFRVI